MAVVEMSKMVLVGLSREKSAILDEIQKCGAVQIKRAEESELASPLFPSGTDELYAEKERTEKAIATIVAAVEELPKKQRPAVEKDGFGVSREEFFGMGQRRKEMSEIISAVEENAKARASIKAEEGETAAKINAYMPYSSLKENFAFYSDTAFASVYLGLISSDKADAFAAMGGESGFSVAFGGEYGSDRIVLLVAHKRDKQSAEELLSSFAFRKCTFNGDEKASDIIEREKARLNSLAEKEDEILKRLAMNAKFTRELKLYGDYLAFLIEKSEADGSLLSTEKAFVLEGYVPTEAKKQTEERIRKTASAAFIDFKAIPRDEFAPTLNKNSAAVSNFETVTNMYSSPAYGALDPNAVMSFFFSLFMGVIMADVGYGLIMIIGGFLFAAKQRDGTAIKRMAKVFAYGGFFAIVFGALFDSWLGLPLLRNNLGASYNDFYAAHIDQIVATTTIAGISVPSILMWCLGLGTAQIAVGLVLKGVQSIGRGRYLEGIFGGYVWAAAMFSLIAWVFGMATGNEPLTTYGLYLTVGLGGLGVLTAGIAEKGFGKVTKIFTSAYGLINYASDILSYARLYGLMLSGAQIASIFTNTLAIEMLFPQGAIGVVAGVLIIIIGNLFNLAMNLLGAYIHDARLQYVEFFGKFYEGEGELFTPFGSKTERIYFKS